LIVSRIAAHLLIVRRIAAQAALCTGLATADLLSIMAGNTTWPD